VLVQLEARDFRNLEPQSLSFAPGLHLVLGDNGAGKTSLLEAVYAVATSRSFRTSRLADCRRHGATGFEIRAEVASAARARLELTWQDGGRQRSVNHRQTSLAEHLAVLPVVAWTAADVEVLVGAPAERRRFLDRGIVGLRPAAIEVLSRFRQALAEKRRWLERPGPAAELDAWNRVLAGCAAELIARRAVYVDALAATLAATLAACDVATAPIELRYRPSPRSGLAGSESLLAALGSVASREIRLGQPVIGPHRDELEILWGGHEIRRVASAGERKLLALALVAAHGKVLEAGGRIPVYLLDDADAELDRDRLRALWTIFGTARQLVATSSRPAVWEALDAHRWRCRRGRLDEEK